MFGSPYVVSVSLLKTEPRFSNDHHSLFAVLQNTFCLLKTVWILNEITWKIHPFLARPHFLMAFRRSRNPNSSLEAQCSHWWHMRSCFWSECLATASSSASTGTRLARPAPTFWSWPWRGQIFLFACSDCRKCPSTLYGCPRKGSYRASKMPLW